MRNLKKKKIKASHSNYQSLSISQINCKVGIEFALVQSSALKPVLAHIQNLCIQTETIEGPNQLSWIHVYLECYIYFFNIRMFMDFIYSLYIYCLHPLIRLNFQTIRFHFSKNDRSYRLKYLVNKRYFYYRQQFIFKYFYGRLK